MTPVLARFQPGSCSLLYGKSSNETSPPHQLVFNPGKKHYCLIFWLLRMRKPVFDPRLHELASRLNLQFCKIKYYRALSMLQF